MHQLGEQNETAKREMKSNFIKQERDERRKFNSFPHLSTQNQLTLPAKNSTRSAHHFQLHHSYPGDLVNRLTNNSLPQIITKHFLLTNNVLKIVFLYFSFEKRRKERKKKIFSLQNCCNLWSYISIFVPLRQHF